MLSKIRFRIIMNSIFLSNFNFFQMLISFPFLMEFKQKWSLCFEGSITKCILFEIFWIWLIQWEGDEDSLSLTWRLIRQYQAALTSELRAISKSSHSDMIFHNITKLIRQYHTDSTHWSRFTPRHGIRYQVQIGYKLIGHYHTDSSHWIGFALRHDAWKCNQIESEKNCRNSFGSTKATSFQN